MRMFCDGSKGKGSIAFDLLAAFGLMSQQAQAGVSITGSSYEEGKAQSCFNKEQCFVTMTAVPAGKTLYLYDVRCHIESKTTTPILYHAIIHGNGVDTPLPTSSAKIVNGTRYTLVGEVIKKAYRAGLKPQINVFFANGTPTFIGASCAIAGSLY